MKIRRPDFWLTAAAAALVLSTAPGRALADGIASNNLGTATYRLTSSVDLPPADPNSTEPQIITNVLPPGAIVPAQTGVDASGNPEYASPLTVLDSSSGFDQAHLAIGLKPPPGDPSTGSQQFGLSFFGEGLKSATNGGQVDFSLSVDKAMALPVLTPNDPHIQIAQLELPAPTNPDTPGTGGNGGTTTTMPEGGTTNSIPEPTSIALWSALAGLGLYRARSASRRKTA